MEIPEELTQLFQSLKSEKKYKHTAKEKFQDPEILKKGLLAYHNPPEFKIGDYVTQIENLDTCKYPQVNHPAIVVGFPKVYEDAESSYYSDAEVNFAYPNKDVILGILIDGTFITIVTNRFRLRKLTDDEVKEYVEFMTKAIESDS